MSLSSPCFFLRPLPLHVIRLLSPAVSLSLGVTRSTPKIKCKQTDGFAGI